MHIVRLKNKNPHIDNPMLDFFTNYQIISTEDPNVYPRIQLTYGVSEKVDLNQYL